MKTIIIIAVFILVAVLAICFLFVFCKAAKNGDKLNFEVYNQPSNKKVFVDKCIVCGKIIPNGYATQFTTIGNTVYRTCQCHSKEEVKEALKRNNIV